MLTKRTATLLLLTLLTAAFTLGGCGSQGSTDTAYWNGGGSDIPSGYTVSGKIISPVTLAPIQGMKCTLQAIDGTKAAGLAYTTTTDDKGNYSFAGLEAGSYRMTTAKEGNITDNSYFTVSQNMTVNQTSVKKDEWTTVMGADHPYDASMAYVSAVVDHTGGGTPPVRGTASSKEPGKEGVVVDLFSGSKGKGSGYQARCYMDAQGKADWNATSTSSTGVALFYKAAPTDTYTMTASKANHAFDDVTGIAPVKGEFTNYMMYSKEATVTQTTKWKVVNNNNVWTMQYCLYNLDDKPQTLNWQDFKCRGMCYSPAPIGCNVKQDWHWGDFFWDSTAPQDYLDCEQIWRRDLDNIKALGVNTIRVYNMMPYINKDGTPNYDLTFQHAKFLNACWEKKIFVLAGVALGDEVWQSEKNSPTDKWVQFWNKSLTESARELEKYPAVIGIIFNNEKDRDLDVTGEYSNFWWNQVGVYSQWSKIYAPDKLNGMAMHDWPPSWYDHATVKSKMEIYGQDLSFWGVNNYQSDSVAFTNIMKAAASTGKGILLTEYGFPATGHKDTSTQNGHPTEASAMSIYEDDTTVKNTADVLYKDDGSGQMMLQTILKNTNILGLYYFEWCDEWWNQANWSGVQSPNDKGIFTQWFGGDTGSGFPNKYWDQMGFGVNSIIYAPDRFNTTTSTLYPWYSDANWKPGANVYYTDTSVSPPKTHDYRDILTPRKAIVNALKNAYSKY